MLRITDVNPLEGYQLKVCFNNGSALILNLENKINTLRFRQLRDQELFKKVSTDDYCIYWNEFIQISINEAFEIAQMPIPIG
jgi:hypothetical protein